MIGCIFTNCLVFVPVQHLTGLIAVMGILAANTFFEQFVLLAICIPSKRLLLVALAAFPHAVQIVGVVVDGVF